MEWTEDLVDHTMTGSRGVVLHRVVHRCVAHRCHIGDHNRGTDLVEGTVVRSSMHLMRVHNRCRVVDQRGRMVDHGVGSVVDHWS